MKVAARLPDPVAALQRRPAGRGEQLLRYQLLNPANSGVRCLGGGCGVRKAFRKGVWLPTLGEMCEVQPVADSDDISLDHQRLVGRCWCLSDFGFCDGGSKEKTKGWVGLGRVLGAFCW